MSCPICLEEIHNVKKLHCNHEFCSDCINQWTKNSCPLCRAEITTSNLGLELYGTYQNCRVYQGNLYGFRPTLNNYLTDSRIKGCVNNHHQMIINKPYGVTIFCKDCRKTIPFNWLS